MMMMMAMMVHGGLVRGMLSPGTAATAFLMMTAFWGQVWAFNIDTHAARVYRGAPGSYFGYAVELHREGDDNMVLVGAPRAQTSQPGVSRGGALFKCPIKPHSSSGSTSTSSSRALRSASSIPPSELLPISHGPTSSTASPLTTTRSTPATSTPHPSASPSSFTSECDQIIVDQNGNEMLDGYEVTNKSGQMHGATVKSSGPDGTIVVCQPLFTWFFFASNQPGAGRFPVGGCFFIRRNFTEISVFQPCKSRDLAFVNFLKCETGFSAAVTEEDWVIGAVGSFYAQGEIFIGNHSTNYVRRSDVTDSVELDYNYRGYSVAFGDFFADGQPEYVIGMPRGDVNIRGMVEFRDRDLHRYHVITGRQLGAYFGHSVTAVDLNDDGYDDVVISAPLYTDVNLPQSHGWEVGRIYINYNDRQSQFPVSQTITGQSPGGRFGFAVASIGDINQDGYTDLAVSAPYFGEEREGRVSIYLGQGSLGLSVAPSQHLIPSQFGVQLSSFGFSLAGGLDLDNNTYPDLAVGSYMSSSMVVFRSRPVVDPNVTVTLNGARGIDLESRDLTLQDGSSVTSFSLTVCLAFTGIAIPETISLSYTMSCDHGQSNPVRALFVTDNEAENEVGREDTASVSEIVSLQAGMEECTHYTGYVLDSIRDKLRPINVRLDYSLAAEDSRTTIGTDLPPILNANTQPLREITIPILRNCNSTICVPDLVLSATSDTAQVAVGSSAVIRLRVRVSNHGEEAYESTLTYAQPPGFSFMRVRQITQNNHKVTCDKKKGFGAKEIICELGNPMVADETIDLELTFFTDDVTGDNEKISFALVASSTHRDRNETLADNVAVVEIDVIIYFYGVLEGSAESEYILYDDNDIEQDEFAPDDIDSLVIHEFKLSNNGPSGMGAMFVSILFPLSAPDIPGSNHSNNHRLLDLIEANVEGGRMCEWDADVHTSVLPETMTTTSSTTSSSESSNSLTNSGRDEADLPAFGRPPARRRRSMTTDTPNSTTVDSRDFVIIDDDNLSTMGCVGDAAVECVEIRCHVDFLGTRKTSRRDSVTVIVMSRFDFGAFFAMNTTKSIEIVSHAEVTVYGSPYTVNMTHNATFDTTATTRILPLEQVISWDTEELAPPDPPSIRDIGIWKVVGACMAGLVVLVITNAVLYKIGFFKRQRIGMVEGVKMRKKPDRMSIRQKSVIFED